MTILQSNLPTLEAANSAECHLIKTTETLLPNGYNIAEGGSNGNPPKNDGSVRHKNCVCTYKDCAFNGKPQALNKFSHDGGKYDECYSICLECQSIRS